MLQHTWDLKKAPLFVTLVRCHTVHLQATEKITALSSQTDREMLYDANWRNNVQENQMNPNKEKLRESYDTDVKLKHKASPSSVVWRRTQDSSLEILPVARYVTC